MELCEPSSLRVALSVAGAHKRASLGSQTALNLTHRPFPLSLTATSKKAHTRERERERVKIPKFMCRAEKSLALSPEISSLSAVKFHPCGRIYVAEFHVCVQELNAAGGKWRTAQIFITISF